MLCNTVQHQRSPRCRQQAQSIFSLLGGQSLKCGHISVVSAVKSAEGNLYTLSEQHVERKSLRKEANISERASPHVDQQLLFIANAK